MPFLHLDSWNQHKTEWYGLVKDHPSQFEVLEWSPEQDKDLLQRSHADVDTQLFPVSCIQIAACMQKLVDYGGITVTGCSTAPTRAVKILLNDWKTLGPPKKFSVRGYGYPLFIDKTSIMASSQGDSVGRVYRDKIIDMMKAKIWEHPEFGPDVAIM